MPPQAPELRDVHVPHVGWWPLAPGWWMLAGLVVVAAILLAWRWRRRIHRRRYVGRVLEDLRRGQARHTQDGDNAAFAASAHALLRRVARTRDPHSVTYADSVWRDALSALAPKRDVTRLATLGEVMYRPGAPLDVDAVSSDIDAWVRDVLMGRAHVAS